METELISIVVPIYNTGDYLERCIKSIIAQTYTNLEIVLFDNASTDNSPEIIAKYSSLDSRIIACKILKHAETCMESYNNAYLHASADWIIPVDSDDEIEEHYVEKLWNRHIETGADLVGSEPIFYPRKLNSKYLI